jgi:hypothetical protein
MDDTEEEETPEQESARLLAEWRQDNERRSKALAKSQPRL